MAGLASRLYSRGHRLVLVTLDDAAADRYQVDPNVRRISLDMMGDSHGLLQKLSHNRARMKAIERVLVEEHPDAVLSFCDRTNITVLLASRRLKIPVIISERSDPAKQRLGFLWELARRKAYPGASRIIALTETSARHLASLNSYPIKVIPSAVDVPPSSSDRELASQEKLIIGVGRLEYEKGFDRLIQAFAAATVDHPDWSLRILGEGSASSELQEIAFELEVNDRVQLPGWVHPVWPELCRATIFALPSRYEGFPSALLEAMAAGVPSISVDCESGPREIIRHERNGLLVRNSVDELAEGIRRLIEDAELREMIGEEGKCVVDEYGWENMVDAYESVLGEVTSAAS